MKIRPALMPILALSVAAMHLWFFSQSPYVNGVDGPYYLIQVESLMRSGRLKYPDPPLTFYVFLGASLLTGNATEAIKAVMAATAGLTVAAVYILAREVTGDEDAALLASLITAASPSLLRLSGDFMKNALGMPILAIYMWAVERVAAHPSKRNLATGIAAGVLLAETHVLPLAMGLAYTALRLPSRKRSLATVLGAVAIATLISAHMFGYTGDLLKALQAVEGVGEPGFGRPQGPTSLGLWAAYLGVAATGIYASMRWRDWRLLAFSAVLLLLSLPVYPPGYQSRFAFVCFLPAAVTLSMMFGRLGSSPGMLGMALIILVSSAAGYGPAMRAVAPKIDEEGYRELLEISRILPENAVVAMRVRLGVGYWVLYLVGDRVVFRAGGGVRPTHMIVERGVPPPPGGVPIFVGRRFVLVELRPPGRGGLG